MKEIEFQIFSCKGEFEAISANFIVECTFKYRAARTIETLVVLNHLQTPVSFLDMSAGILGVCPSSRCKRVPKFDHRESLIFYYQSLIYLYALDSAVNRIAVINDHQPTT